MGQNELGFGGGDGPDSAMMFLKMIGKMLGLIIEERFLMELVDLWGTT